MNQCDINLLFIQSLQALTLCVCIIELEHLPGGVKSFHVAGKVEGGLGFQCSVASVVLEKVAGRNASGFQLISTPAYNGVRIVS